LFGEACIAAVRCISFIPFRFSPDYISLHFVALRYVAFYLVAFHCISFVPFLLSPDYISLHFIAFHCISFITLLCITFHLVTFRFIFIALICAHAFLELAVQHELGLTPLANNNLPACVYDSLFGEACIVAVRCISFVPFRFSLNYISLHFVAFRCISFITLRCVAFCLVAFRFIFIALICAHALLELAVQHELGLTPFANNNLPACVHDSLFGEACVFSVRCISFVLFRLSHDYISLHSFAFLCISFITSRYVAFCLVAFRFIFIALICTRAFLELAVQHELGLTPSQITIYQLVSVIACSGKRVFISL